jgi:chaperonin GroEL
MTISANNDKIIDKFIVDTIEKVGKDRVMTVEGSEGAIVLGMVRQGNGAFGFNAGTEEYEELVAAGIIDPMKVVPPALENAAGIALLMITTECLVTEAPEKKEKPAPPEGY